MKLCSLLVGVQSSGGTSAQYILKMEAACTFETLLGIYQTTRRQPRRPQCTLAINNTLYHIK